MNHFFVDPTFIDGKVVRFPQDISHQICRVLRLRIDDLVVVLDNLGKQYEVQLVDLSPQECVGEVLRETIADTEPQAEIHLFIALTQREKFEWILQKCCEVGVGKITPVLTERTIVASRMEFPKKRDRWERILKEAAEQSKRGRIPPLCDPLEFKQTVKVEGSLKLIAWENEKTQKVDAILDNLTKPRIALLVGPEGGFLWLRTITSTLLGQGLDTLIFVTLATLLGVFPWVIWGSLVVSNYIFKVGIEVLMTPATYFVISKLKKAESEDYYDRNTRFKFFSMN